MDSNKKVVPFKGEKKKTGLIKPVPVHKIARKVLGGKSRPNKT
jgi:hypothetical protein